MNRTEPNPIDMSIIASHYTMKFLQVIPINAMQSFDIPLYINFEKGK